MAVNSYREDEFMENTDKKKIFRRLFSYLLEYKAILIGVLLCMAVTVAISLVNPLLIEEAIDHYIANKDMKGLMGLGSVCAGTEYYFYHYGEDPYVRDGGGIEQDSAAHPSGSVRTHSDAVVFFF